MSVATSTSPPGASLLFSHPLSFLRTSSHSGQSMQSGLMLDMPTTPTNEQRRGFHSELPSPASTSTHPLASFPSSSPAASPAAASASPSVATPAGPPLRARCRSWLVTVVVPLFSNKFTRLLVSLILVTFNVIVLYFAAFAFYLTHFLSRSAMEGADELSDDSSVCSSFPLSLFLVFLFFRSLCSLLLIAIRMRDSSMWVNQRSQMSRHQRAFHLLSLGLYLTSAAFLALGVVWLASSESRQCVQLARPLVAALVVYEALAVTWPLGVLACLSALFPWKALSPFTPYIPLTTEAFVQERQGLSRREIDSLPSFVYTAGLYADDDRRCSICLGDLEAGERVRPLRCSHRFHLECINEWLLKKPTCPLCVQKVEAERKQRRIRFSFSRTRRHSATANEEAGQELSVSARSLVAASSVRINEHEHGLEMDGTEMV